MHAFYNFITLPPPQSPPSINLRNYILIQKYEILVQINAYQEGTKVNSEVNDWVLKNPGT